MQDPQAFDRLALIIHQRLLNPAPTPCRHTTAVPAAPPAPTGWRTRCESGVHSQQPHMSGLANGDHFKHFHLVTA